MGEGEGERESGCFACFCHGTNDRDRRRRLAGEFIYMTGCLCGAQTVMCVMAHEMGDSQGE